MLGLSELKEPPGSSSTTAIVDRDPRDDARGRPALPGAVQAGRWYRHVLIDEAQDTAPEQWEVIKKLTEEFFSGEGARRAPRTIFAVGDVKRSIFSFQGADPAAFLRQPRLVRRPVPGAGHDWRPIPLRRRSARPSCLTAVDATFRDAEMAR